MQPTPRTATEKDFFNRIINFQVKAHYAGPPPLKLGTPVHPPHGKQQNATFWVPDCPSKHNRRQSIRYPKLIRYRNLPKKIARASARPDLLVGRADQKVTSRFYENRTNLCRKCPSAQKKKREYYSRSLCCSAITRIQYRHTPPPPISTVPVRDQPDMFSHEASDRFSI